MMVRTHNGKTGQLVQEGTFEVFGQMVTGVKYIDSTNGHTYWAESGEYEIVPDVTPVQHNKRFVRVMI